MKYSISFKQHIEKDETYIESFILTSIDNKIKIEDTNLDKIFELKGSNKITVSSLEYWGPFLITYLFKNGYKSDEDSKTLTKKYTFNTLINSSNDWYRITVKSKNGKIQFENFEKKIGTTVEAFMENMHIEGIENDGINYAIKMLDEQKLDCLTIGSACVKDFKRMGYCHSAYTRIDDKQEEFIRASYHGGLCGKGNKDEYESKITVIDMNSMYPFVMCKYPLPFSNGKYVEGKCKSKLFIQRFIATLRLKKGKIPCLVQKNMFMGVEPIYFDRCELTLTSVDIDNMYKNYEVYNLIYIDGYEYEECKGQYIEYVEKWYSNKLNSKKENNISLYYLSKLMLNNLSGKLAAKRKFEKKNITIDKNGELKDSYTIIDSEDWYLPAACFITAYARKELIEASEIVGNEILYYDTDSLHVAGDVNNLERIDDFKLGYWKVEGIYEKGIYIKEKVYAEKLIDGEWEYTVAGCPYEAKQQITEDNFKEGTVLKITNTKKIKGGCIKKESTFTI